MIKRHPTYQDYYISSDGRVFSSRQYKDKSKMREIKPYKNHKGYSWIGIATDNGRVRRAVYHLVLEAFDRFANAGEVARHLNGDNHDNRIQNLAWGTAEENVADMHKHNAIRVASGYVCMNKKISIAHKKYYKNNPDVKPKGEQSPNAKLSDFQAKEIIDRCANGEFKKRLANEYGVSQKTVLNIVRGVTYAHLTRAPEHDIEVPS